jgi:hypothetical protein
MSSVNSMVEEEIRRLRVQNLANSNCGDSKSQYEYAVSTFMEKLYDPSDDGLTVDYFMFKLNPKKVTPKTLLLWKQALKMVIISELNKLGRDVFDIESHYRSESTFEGTAESLDIKVILTTSEYHKQKPRDCKVTRLL